MAFLRAQASAIVVTDLLSVDTVFLKRLYVLLYMELANRLRGSQAQAAIAPRVNASTATGEAIRYASTGAMTSSSWPTATRM